jgi:hypothetical protein
LMSRTDLRHWKSHRHATLPFKVRMHQPAERLVHLYFKETQHVPICAYSTEFHRQFKKAKRRHDRRVRDASSPTTQPASSPTSA